MFDVLESRRMMTITYVPMTEHVHNNSTSGDNAVRIDYASGVGVMTWAGMSDGANMDIFARRVDGDGAFIGSAFRVNSNTPASQSRPSSGIAADGSFVVTWFDSSNLSIRFQRFDAAAQAIGDETTVVGNLPSGVSVGEVAMTPDGRFVIVWSSRRGPDLGSPRDVFAQRYDAKGTAVGSPIRVNAAADTNVLEPSVAIEPSGNFILAWRGDDGDGNGISMRRFDVSGIPLGPETPVNTTTANQQYEPKVRFSPTGGFVVICSTLPGSDMRINMQRFDDDGLTVGGEMRVSESAGSPQHATLTFGDDGRFAVAWQDPGAGTAMLRVFEADGTGNEERALGAGLNLRYDWPYAALVDDGRVLLAYSTLNPDRSYLATVRRTLLVEGTADADAIALAGSGGDVVETVNGISTTHDVDFEMILVESGDGGDSVRHDALPASLSGGHVIMGGAGNDTIAGWVGPDTILGFDGDDSLRGYGGADVLSAGAGHDTVRGDEDDDMVSTGSGRDLVVAGSGSDVVDAGIDPDTVYGNDGNDTINSGQGRDRVFAGAGDDHVRAFHHDDTILGEDGDDRLHGDPGNDHLDGGAGNDYVAGQTGDDQIRGGPGSDNLYGNEDNDTIDAFDNVFDRIDGGPDSDTVDNDPLDRLFNVETLI